MTHSTSELNIQQAIDDSKFSLFHWTLIILGFLILASAPSARTSRRASPGTARNTTTCSIWIAICRGGSTNAAATACRSCCR